MIAKGIPRVPGGFAPRAASLSASRMYQGMFLGMFLGMLLVAAIPLRAQPAPDFSAAAEARPGDPVFVWSSASGVTLVSAELRGPKGALVSRARGFALGDRQGAILAIPSTMGPGEARIIAEFLTGSGERLAGERPLGIVGRTFAAEEIPLGRENTSLRAAPDPRREEQTREFAVLFRQADPGARYLDTTMNRPLGTWRVTSGFGDRRRYRYEGGGTDTSIHCGLDLAAPAGTPVMACAPGRVVFADLRILTGNTIVIEHLPGLFSIYMHLDAISVAAGALVAAARPIGTVGSTGLSTGPHLHWELRVGEVPVDPEFFLTRDPVPSS